ncbi:hypothetical protein HDU98_006848 [Podochytrium sp. JEL0797]|nr:hypothetical protein HDU98_006848 [Podochytrium sp. JEL0797]
MKLIGPYFAIIVLLCCIPFATARSTLEDKLRQDIARLKQAYANQQGSAWKQPEGRKDL